MGKLSFLLKWSFKLGTAGGILYLVKEEQIFGSSACGQKKYEEYTSILGKNISLPEIPKLLPEGPMLPINRAVWNSAVMTTFREFSFHRRYLFSPS